MAAGMVGLTAVAALGAGLTSTAVPASAAEAPPARADFGPGYHLVTAGGGVLPFGSAPRAGGLPSAGSPTVAVARTGSGEGYWLADRQGGVYTYGDARFYGAPAGGGPLRAPIVAMAATPTGRGYWLAAEDGGVFAYGDARFYGSAASKQLRAPIVDLATLPSGRGYWLLGRDGGVFAFGKADFEGSAADLGLRRPAVAIESSPTGEGYWVAGADGGVFTYGDAPFLGSSGGFLGSTPVVGLAAGRGRVVPAAEAAEAAAVANLRSRQGHDISWPQCGGAFPEPGYGHGIVGVTGGRPFTVNRCLAEQWQWALAGGSGASVYVNLDAPRVGDTRGLSGPGGTCAVHDRLCQAYNYGANDIAAALVYAQASGVDAPMWWLDVETMNHWDSVAALNRRVIEGAIDALRAAGIRVGIYSTPYQWRLIAGDFQPGLPVWVAGAPTDAEAPTWCGPHKSFGGGEVWLVQALPIRFDNNWACDPAVREAATAFRFSGRPISGQGVV